MPSSAGVITPLAAKFLMTRRQTFFAASLISAGMTGRPDRGFGSR
jgi:hypothetical protein